MSVDDSELRKLAKALSPDERKVMKAVRKVASKGSLNVKNQIIKDFKSSRHFKGGKKINWNRDIRYNLTETANRVESEIGPYVDNDGFGTLVGIAIHGGSRGGGGTVPDPIHALKAEEPKFIAALEELGGTILDE